MRGKRQDLKEMEFVERKEEYTSPLLWKFYEILNIYKIYLDIVRVLDLCTMKQVETCHIAPQRVYFHFRVGYVVMK